jgi:uncharacterized iron-regulated protein
VTVARLRHARVGVAVMVGVVLAGCAMARPVGGPWQATHGREHELTGRIWDVRRARFLSPEALTARLGAARLVLLGETHDNPDHHRLQAWIVRALITAGRRPAVAFEMLSPEEAPALAAHLAAAPVDVAGLGAAVGWTRRGWPDWTMYQPIAEAALDAGLPLLPANITAGAARALVRGEPAGLDSGLVTRFGLDRPPAPPVTAALAAEIREAHCGHVPERLVPGMVAAQRARDATMAERLLAAGPAGAVLIAGAGHVRVDRGVPAYVRAVAPEVALASLAFLEVSPEWALTGGAPVRAAGPPPFDYVWFTPRVDEGDPCDRFRQPLERLRNT